MGGECKCKCTLKPISCWWEWLANWHLAIPDPNYAALPRQQTAEPVPPKIFTVTHQHVIKRFLQRQRAKKMWSRPIAAVPAQAVSRCRHGSPAPAKAPISPMGRGHPQLTEAMIRQSYIVHEVYVPVRQTTVGPYSAPSCRFPCCQLAARNSPLWLPTILPVVRRREGQRRPELFRTSATSPRTMPVCAGRPGNTTKVICHECTAEKLEPCFAQ